MTAVSPQPRSRRQTTVSLAAAGSTTRQTSPSHLPPVAGDEALSPAPITPGEGAAITNDRNWAFDLYSMFARGGDDETLHYAVIEGDPWSKSRPRFARGRAYQPRDDLAAEQALKYKLKASGAKMFPGNVMLVCRFYRGNYQRIDTDNLLKHVCDSANGILWKDDSQVTLVLGEVLYDPQRPRTIILAGNHASTLLRGMDAHRECERCRNLFVPPTGKLRDAQRFCSSKCAYAARLTALPVATCKQCGEAYQPKTKRQVLCSPLCRVEWMRNRNKSKGGPPSRCAECGKELTHRRGGRCRECWRKAPGFYGDAKVLPDGETS